MTKPNNSPKTCTIRGKGRPKTNLFGTVTNEIKRRASCQKESRLNLGRRHRQKTMPIIPSCPERNKLLCSKSLKYIENDFTIEMQFTLKMISLQKCMKNDFIIEMHFTMEIH